MATGIRVAELDVSSCGLAALPAALPHLGRTLRVLCLKYNPSLASLDVDALCQLPRLEVIDADGCGITALDAEALSRLTSLRHLSLASNGLAYLPDSISSLPALAVLCVSNNPLSALPEDLGACPALEVLDVSGCRLAGDSLPPSLALCRTLQRLFCQVGLGVRVLHAQSRSWCQCAAGRHGRSTVGSVKASLNALPPMVIGHAEQRPGQGAHMHGPPQGPEGMEPSGQPPTPEVRAGKPRGSGCCIWAGRVQDVGAGCAAAQTAGNAEHWPSLYKSTMLGTASPCFGSWLQARERGLAKFLAFLRWGSSLPRRGSLHAAPWPLPTELPW